MDEQGQIVGYAFVGEGNGYGGVVRVLVGVDEATDQVLNVKILNHAETPGLGSRIEEEGFRSQFAGKTVDDPITVNQDIQIISGATISSRAVADAVREGLQDTVRIYREGVSMARLWKNFVNGLWNENPTFRIMIGLCPVLAVTTEAINGIGMGLATTFVLVCSSALVSLLRKVIPEKVRIPAYIVVIATFVTIVDLFMNAYLPDLHQVLGLFIP